MRGKAVKKDSISIDILPPRPNRALRSLLSVALSSRWAKTVYHNYSKNIINQIKIVLDMGYTSDCGCCAEYPHIKKHTFGAKKYLLSIIHYLLSKVHRLCKWFLLVCSAGLLFRAESVRAGLVTARKIAFPNSSGGFERRPYRYINIFRGTFQSPTGKRGCCTPSTLPFSR